MKKRAFTMTHKYHTRLPDHLEKLRDEIERYACGYGLDFFEVVFEMLDWNQINEVAAYGGFPNRYPHWRFGMEYEQLSKGYEYGLSKIYEMVINNDPCYAYLLHANGMVDQKLVMAHVYAHCDFFKNNVYFAHTNRKMMDEMANHKTRVARAINRFGHDRVESFVDDCLSLEPLIDPHAPAIQRRSEKEAPHGASVERLRANRPYMEKFINPKEFMKEQQKWLESQASEKQSFPENPQRDVMLFLLENAPLEGWESDILSMIREESYYFRPQGQTKIMNEGWACLTRDNLVFTDSGLLSIGEIVERKTSVYVHDGNGQRAVIDYAAFSKRKTVKITTKRGYELEGSETHRILMSDGESWRRLDELSVGDPVQLSTAANLWPEEYVELDWQPKHRPTLQDIADEVGVNISTIVRHKYGKFMSRSASAIDAALVQYEASIIDLGYMQNNRQDVDVPSIVDERLGAFLGYLVGDGHISLKKRTIGLTTADEDQSASFKGLCLQLFSIEPKVRKDGSRYRISMSSENLREYLTSLGLKTGQCAREKCVPDVILRSPKSVVSAFLRALFDADGYAGPSGVILSTSSDNMARHVQLLLLNFGILSAKRLQKHDIWNVQVLGRYVRMYLDEVGFNLRRKQERLEEYVRNRKWYKKQSPDDVIKSIEYGEADVFDITVDETHCYAAQGFINHNSYWHSKILTEKALNDDEIIDYADRHSGSMLTRQGQLNPYKLGIELFRDIEDRWNKGRFGREYEECSDMVAKKRWDKKLGQGREKIFEVRRLYNDLNFIDTFLTPEFCQEQKLFVYAYNISSDQFEIANREFDKIKKQLLFSLTNMGRPIIEVINGNYQNRGELLLVHRHEGIDLRSDYARATLMSLFNVWRRPVHIETVVDGAKKIIGFDGKEHTETSV